MAICKKTGFICLIIEYKYTNIHFMSANYLTTDNKIKIYKFIDERKWLCKCLIVHYSHANPLP